MADWDPADHPFLTDVSRNVFTKDGKATVAWNIDQGPWKFILENQGLTPADDVLPTKTGENIGLVLTWAPKDSQGNTLLRYQFSSDRNSSFFLDDDNWHKSSRNTATAGDDNKSGVLLLRPSKKPQDPLALQQKLLPAFGIGTSDKGELLSKLLNKLDADLSTAVTANVKSAPAWIPPADRSASFNLPNNINVRNRNPVNALWCHTTDSSYVTAISVTYLLQFNRQALADLVRDIFNGLKPKAIQSDDATAKTDVEITFTKLSTFTETTDTDGKPTLLPVTTTIVSLAFPLQSEFILHLDLIAGSSSEIRVVLVPTGQGSLFGMIGRAFHGLQSADTDVLPKDDKDEDGVFGVLQDIAKNVDIRFWYVGLTLGQSNNPSVSINWEFGIIIVLRLGSGTAVKHLPLGFSYDSTTRTFFGQTIFKQNLATTEQVRAIGWDTRLDPAAVIPDYTGTLMDGVNLLSLIDLDSSESLFNPVLTYASVSVRKGTLTEPSEFTLTGKFLMEITADPLLPTSWLENEFAIDLRVQKRKPNTTYDIRASNTLVLTGALTSDELKMTPNPAPPVAVISLMLSYVSLGKQWSFRASARDLSLRHLRPLFDADSQNECLDVLDHIQLSHFDVEYTFGNKLVNSPKASPKASSFRVSGTLKLGDLDLTLTFSRNSDNFEFVAELDPDSPSSTIASIIDSVVPGAADSLPEFVGSISIDPLGTSTAGTPLCRLEYRTGKTIGGKAVGVISCLVNIAGFVLSFVQMKIRGATPAQSITKRFLRISADQIPLLDRVPIVGKMPQPFDALLYLWIQDSRSKSSPATDSSKLGFTQPELDDIGRLSRIPPIQTKSTATTNEKGKATKIVLAAGHHFVVIVGSTVVLDHVFHTSRAETAPKSVADFNASELGLGPSQSVVAAPEAQPTKGSTSMSSGLLKIQALTFQYKREHLLIGLDATLTLGPISFSVIGFTIDINLKGVKLDHLADIVTKKLVSIDLHGIAVGVSKPPLTLKGVFIHEKGKSYESYSGGIAVGLKAWQVLAVGQYYVQLDSQGREDFKAVFIYGKLDGPLITLEFATISGVRVGFGYNFAIRMPELNELASFPLISDKGLGDAGNDPLVVLNAIRSGDRPFVFPKKDAAWFAAGMTITAFEVMTLTAVAVFDIEGVNGPNPGVVIAMFADGVFQMPPEAPPDFSLFYLEVVVKVEFNLVHGFIAADAALAPSSHIYVPMARLTGSASFRTWFSPNEHAGDWIVSIGGYPRGYKPALWYPRPDRIKLSFTVGNNIQISGEAYCAVTPKCAMAGGRMHLSLKVGPVTAWADITFDAYINFKPFHFRAEMKLSVGVSCNVDIGLIHLHVTVKIGADLRLWGPHDFGGRAHVDFWFFAFNISFGADEDPRLLDAASLKKFIEMVTQGGPPGDVRETDTVGAKGQENLPHKFSVENGLAPLGTPPEPEKGTNNFPSTGATKEWHVLAGTLAIRVDCGFALSAAFLSRNLINGQEQAPTPILGPGGTSAPDVYSWPMHCQVGQKIKSELTVTIRHIISDNDQPIVDSFRAELISKPAAKALWAPWSSKLDPLHDGGRQPDHLRNADNATVDLVQSIRILPPPPLRAPSKILDMDAAAAMVFTIPGDWRLPTFTDAEQTKAKTIYSPETFHANDTDPNRWDDFSKLFTIFQKPNTFLGDNMKAKRQLIVDAIAETQEWAVRPPAQMSRATRGPGVLFSEPITAVENKPRVRANGRTDYQLSPDVPFKMAEMLENYCLALPQVLVR